MLPPRHPRSTSQRHCARNASSNSAASTCGRPKRSRVKNPPMRRRRVFYHVEGRFGKLPAMDEPKDDASTDGQLGNIAPPAAISDSPSKYTLRTITPSPFEQRVHKIFIGPDGLRPVWRFALYLILYRALYFALQIFIYYALSDV